MQFYNCKMEKILSRGLQRAANIDTRFVRDFMGQVNWKNRLIAIKGSRGVGKTTLLLQHIKLHRQLNQEVGFANLDDLYFSENRLLDFIEEFVQHGGKWMYLDEVHKYPGWSVEIKNAYDYFPDLTIVVTGSSITEILNASADLSRRAVVYDMQGLSFREYLNLSFQLQFEKIQLADLTERHTELAAGIVRELKPLAHFSEYLKTGYYPYFLEGKEDYWTKINQTVKLILEVDLTTLKGYNVQHVHKINRLLFTIASSVPFKPNISKLSERIGLNRNLLGQYFHYLEQARLLNLLSSDRKGLAYLQKPDKVFLENTNLQYAIAPANVDKGNLRETFFFNQLNYVAQVRFPSKGDFIINDKFLFEVGGKNKKASQVKGVENYFLAVDDVEVGIGTQIPLWLLGFLY